MAESNNDQGRFGGLLASPLPLLLGALGPGGAAVGLGSFLFGRNRQRQRERDALSELYQFDGDLATASEEEILAEIQQLTEAGAPRSQIQTYENVLTRRGQAETRALAQQAEERAQAAERRQRAETNAIATDRLADNVRPIATEIADAQAAMRVAIAAPDTFAGDETLMTNFARLVVGPGVLSDQDIQRVAGSSALSAVLSRAKSQVEDGTKLGEGERRAIRQMTALILEARIDAAGPIINPSLRTAKRLGLVEAEIIDPSLLEISDDVQALIEAASEANPGLPRPPTTIQLGTDPTPDRPYRDAAGNVVVPDDWRAVPDG